MTPEQIYKANISSSHEAALDAVFNAGVTVGMGKMADGLLASVAIPVNPAMPGFVENKAIDWNDPLPGSLDCPRI